VAIIKTTFLFLLLCLSFVDMQGQIKDLPKIKDTALPKVDSLKAAIVTGTMRPKIKGDTLEYNTKHMQVSPNAVVEDLLRRLPGLEIDPDGTISYNGEKIQHLLIDGQDVFASDATMVTRNFDASKIAAVQLLDRKTDRAIFAGVDDGTRVKTLNLVMKDSAKDGYFGKVEGGGDADGYYNAGGALTAFQGKSQFSALGLASNTGALGFGGSGGAISITNGGSDALGASAGYGVPHAEAAALHFANTWKREGQHVNANYQYSHYYTEPMASTVSVQAEPDSVYGQQQVSRSANREDRHGASLVYEWKAGVRSAFRLGGHATYSQGENRLGSTGNDSFNDTVVNSSLRSIIDKNNAADLGGNMAWRLSSRRRNGRLFSVEVEANKMDNTTNGYVYSLDRFYTPNGVVQRVDTTDQRKQIISHSWNVMGSVNYAEPIWMGVVLGLSYGLSYTGNDPLQATFGRANGKYTELVDSLSSQVNTGTTSQYGTVSFEGKKGPVSFSIGNDWLGYGYRQAGVNGEVPVRLGASNMAPRALLTYSPNSETVVMLDYFTATQQPSAAQLMPVVSNSDPLHLVAGNPDLKPSYNQRLNLNLRHLGKWLVNIGMSISTASEGIGTKTTTDSLGRQTSQAVNVDGGRIFNLNVSISRRVLGFDAGFYGIARDTRSVNYVNTDLNRNDAFSAGGGASLTRFVPNKYGLELRTNFTYFDQSSSINTAAPVQYWTQNHQGSVTLYFIQGFEINTNVNYTWQEKTGAFGSNTSILLWNGFVARNFMHNKLVARFQMNNLLNQNAGISRSNSLNVNTQSSMNILGRYWMVSATYHFDRKFKKK
jgi:hypothetical protein